MKAYSLFVYTICCIYRYTFIKIKPELKKGFLKFGYSINYKYEGMLAHSFYRFYVFKKFILPTAKALNFDRDCKYLGDRSQNQTEEARQHI